MCDSSDEAVSQKCLSGELDVNDIIDTCLNGEECAVWIGKKIS